MNQQIHIIACLATNRAIGYDNHLIYHIPEDMQRFKALTMGKVIIMGRKTYESLPAGALPGRTNVVLSRQDIKLKDCHVCHSLEEAIRLYPRKEIFIIGGAAVYEEALSLASYMHLTLVDDLPAQADTFFPSYSEANWETASVNVFIKNNRKTTFLTLKRTNNTPNTGK